MMSRDSEAIEELRAVASPGALHTILHYLYFPAKNAADHAAAALRSQGFTTEECLDTDGVNWLVLAQHRIVPSEETIGAARMGMERLANGAAGEYDGWEADVQS